MPESLREKSNSIWVCRMRRCARIGLLAHPARKAAGHDRDQQEDDERQEFMRARDGECVERLDEEEIVGEEGQDGGEDGATACRN